MRVGCSCRSVLVSPWRALGRRGLAGLLSIALVSQATLSWANEPDERVTERASLHFTEAVEAYRQGNYPRAITELERALALDPDGKDLIYNLGLVHERLGELDRALSYYQRLLALEEDELERARLVTLIERVQGAHALQQKPAPGAPPEAPPAAAPARERGRLDGWVWGTGGVAAVALTLGVVFGLRAWALHPGGSPHTGPGQSSAEVHEDARSAHSLAVLADVSFGVALLSGAAAAGLYFGREAPAPAAQQVSSGLGLGALPYGISYRGRF